MNETCGPSVSDFSHLWPSLSLSRSIRIRRKELTLAHPKANGDAAEFAGKKGKKKKTVVTIALNVLPIRPASPSSGHKKFVD